MSSRNRQRVRKQDPDRSTPTPEPPSVPTADMEGDETAKKVTGSRSQKDGSSPVPGKKKRIRPPKIKVKIPEPPTPAAQAQPPSTEVGAELEISTAESELLESSNPASLDSSTVSQFDSSKEEATELAEDEASKALSGSTGCLSSLGEEGGTEELDQPICSLCACGKKSLLGQGDLTRYEPTPNFNPFKKQLGKSSRRSSSELDDRSGEKSPKHLTWRRARGPLKPGRERSKSPRRPNPHSITDADGRPIATVDELNTVGYPEDTDIHRLFESSGHTSAHHCCAAWSDGVIQAEDYTLQYVDKAVFAGTTQKCAYCRKFGATINCRYQKCNKKYHYPCASGGGCFQDIKTLSLLCPDHTDQAVSIAGQEALCVVCDQAGDVLEQLFCTSCGQHYHGTCLDPPVQVNPIVRAGWQCPECKICQTCRQPGDDNKMLVCDTCDKGYHTFCLRPVMTTIPKNGWKCKNCRVCGDCGSRTPGSGPSSRWHLNYSVCDSCYQQRNKGLSCPVCGKAYRQFTQKAMAQCGTCKKYVHNDCDSAVDFSTFTQQQQAEYICSVCKDRPPDNVPMETNLTESLNSMIEETDLVDMQDFSIFQQAEGSVHEESLQEADLQSSQESLLLDDNSMSSMDIDLNVLEKGAAQLVQLTNQQSPHLSAMLKSGSGGAASKIVGPGKGKPSSVGKKKVPSAPTGRARTSGKKAQKRPTVTGKKKKVPTAALR